MKFGLITTIAAAAILFTGYTGGNTYAQESTAGKLETPEEKISYIIGRNTAEQLKRDGIDIDPKTFLLAIEDVQSDTKSRLSPEEVQATIAELQQKVAAEQAAAQAGISAANKKEGEAYLKENGAKEGVTTLESGLQYKVITAGQGGPKPTATDTVTVHYKGTLLNGKEFDSSYARGEPATFPLSGVIPGWTEVVQLMSVGDKWEVSIPSNLAYGPNGAGEDIGPDATLKFDIELLKIGQ